MTLTHHTPPHVHTRTMHTSHRHIHHTLACSKVSWSTVGCGSQSGVQRRCRVRVDTLILTLWI